MTKFRFALGTRALVLLAVFTNACSLNGSAAVGGPGGFGATTGGIKDLNAARALVERGQLPAADLVRVEGMLAEHDLPLPSVSCSRELCLNASATIAPTLEGDDAGWMQLGLSSSVNADSFERAPIAAVMVVDVSGSMGWGNSGSPGELARSILHRLDGLLDERDQVAIIAYGSRAVVHMGFVPGGSAVIAERIEALAEDGATNMEAGVALGYEAAASLAASDPKARLFLFTDENPNVGATEASVFEDMVAQAAESGVGMTVFGLGAYVDAENLAAMSHLPLANAFTATLPEHIDSTFEESWPWMMSPIARDLHIRVQAPEGIELAASYGVPEGTNPSEVALDVGSVFLSRKRGAILLQFQASEEAPLFSANVHASISYDDLNGDAVSEAFDVAFPGGDDEITSTSPSTELAVALAVLTSGLHEAIELVDTPVAAQALGAEVLARAHEDALRLNRAEFDDEVDFAVALVALLPAAP